MMASSKSRKISMESYRSTHLVGQSSFKRLEFEEGNREEYIDSVKTLFLFGYIKKTQTF